MNVMTADKVYLVQHVRGDDDDSYKVIGIYSDIVEAKSAVRRLSIMPGFSSYPDGFVISECKINHTEWREGFVDL